MPEFNGESIRVIVCQEADLREKKNKQIDRAKRNVPVGPPAFGYRGTKDP